MVALKIIGIIVSIIIIIFSTITMAEMAFETEGAELGGALTGYFIIMGISLTILYYSSRESSPKSNPQFDSNSKTEIDNGIIDLKNLYDKGILSKEEFEMKIKEFEKAQIEFKVKQSQEYHQLKRLHDDGFLTSNEFYEKIELLKKTFIKSKETETSTLRSRISLKGFKKAVEIYSLAMFKKDSDLFQKLALRLEQQLNLIKTGNSDLWVRRTLFDYKSNNPSIPNKIRILKTVNMYKKSHDSEMGNFEKYRITFYKEKGFLDVGKTTSDEKYFLKYNNEYSVFENLKSCINYLTNNN